MARITVLGNSGTGKSYYAGYLLEQVVPEVTFAVHFDPEDEEIGLSHPDHDPLYQTLYTDKKTASAVDWLKVVYNHRKVRVVPEGLTTDEQRQIYARLCDVVMSLCSDVVPEATAFISADEAHNFLGQANFPTQVERMISGGRKHGVECLHISQRPQLLHTTVISLADRRVYFGVHDDNDLGKIDRTANFSADRLNGLEERHCIVENKSSGEWEQINTDGIGRQRPHFADDDGIADQALPV